MLTERFYRRGYRVVGRHNPSRRAPLLVRVRLCWGGRGRALIASLPRDTGHLCRPQPGGTHRLNAREQPARSPRPWTRGGRRAPAFSVPRARLRPRPALRLCPVPLSPGEFRRVAWSRAAARPRRPLRSLPGPVPGAGGKEVF